MSTQPNRTYFTDEMKMDVLRRKGKGHDGHADKQIKESKIQMGSAHSVPFFSIMHLGIYPVLASPDLAELAAHYDLEPYLFK